MRSPVAWWRQRRVDDPAAAEEYGLYGRMSVASGIAVADCGAPLMLDLLCTDEVFYYYTYRCQNRPDGSYCGQHRWRDPAAIDKAIARAARRVYGWWRFGALRTRRVLLSTGARVLIASDGTAVITDAARNTAIPARSRALAVHRTGGTGATATGGAR